MIEEGNNALGWSLWLAWAGSEKKRWVNDTTTRASSTIQSQRKTRRMHMIPFKLEHRFAHLPSKDQGITAREETLFQSRQESMATLKRSKRVHGWRMRYVQGGKRMSSPKATHVVFKTGNSSQIWSYFNEWLSWYVQVDSPPNVPIWQGHSLTNDVFWARLVRCESRENWIILI
jgi:hypothetical protein